MATWPHHRFELGRLANTEGPYFNGPLPLTADPNVFVCCRQEISPKPTLPALQAAPTDTAGQASHLAFAHAEVELNRRSFRLVQQTPLLVEDLDTVNN